MYDKNNKLVSVILRFGFDRLTGFKLKNHPVLGLTGIFLNYL